MLGQKVLGQNFSGRTLWAGLHAAIERRRRLFFVYAAATVFKRCIGVNPQYENPVKFEQILNLCMSNRSHYTHCQFTEI
jgi:hypothetical protein